MTGMGGNTPILTNSRSYDTMTPTTTTPTNATIIKSNREQHHLTVEQIDVEDRDCERQGGWMDKSVDCRRWVLTIISI